jgi:hypothetical protein
MTLAPLRRLHDRRPPFHISAPRVQQVVRGEALPAVSFVQPSGYTARISSVLPRAFIAPAIPSILEV